MKISELITKLQEVQAEHGDLPVLTRNGESDFDEYPFVGVAKFVPSGNKYCGGDWAIVAEYAKHLFKPRRPAVYLSHCSRN